MNLWWPIQLVQYNHHHIHWIILSSLHLSHSFKSENNFFNPPLLLMEIPIIFFLQRLIKANMFICFVGYALLSIFLLIKLKMFGKTPLAFFKGGTQKKLVRNKIELLEWSAWEIFGFRLKFVFHWRSSSIQVSLLSKFPSGNEI